MQSEPRSRIAKRFHPEFQIVENASIATSSIISGTYSIKVTKDFGSLGKYLKTNQFISLWTMSFLTINMSTFMIGNFQQFASDYIND